MRHADDIEVVGVASSVAESNAAAASPLDVVLMDYMLPDGTGADATRVIKARWPSAKVIMLTGITDDETMLDSINAGADGYLTKETAGIEVVEAVRAAHAGEMLLPRAVALELAQRIAASRGQPNQPTENHNLTARELEVLAALSEGRSSRDICATLYIAPNTLRTHVQNITTKLRVHSKLEAVAFALRQQLVPPPSTRAYTN